MSRRTANDGIQHRRPQSPHGASFLNGIFAPRRNSEESARVQAVKYAGVLTALALTTWALWPVRETIGLLNIGLVYLIVILGATIWAGQWAGIASAVLGFALFDFFLVPPYLTFVIGDLHNILALFVFLGESVLISWLLAGAREQARQASQRADDVTRLYELGQAILGAKHLVDVLPAITRKVADLLDGGVCWLLVPNEQQQLVTRAQHPVEARQLSRDEMALASWVFWHGQDIGLGDQTRKVFSDKSPRPKPSVSRNSGFFAPLMVGGRTIGVLGVMDKLDGRPFTKVERTILSTLADQAAVALERLRLLREAERAEVLARTDELKSALVSAVSHDLRTPLASMMTLVTGLLDQEIRWDEKTQREFHQDIYDELVRLNRLVGNLLDMSRIEGGALRPEKDWYNIGEVVQSVAERLESRLADHPLSLKLDDDLPLAFFDFTEIEQVLTNLVENAIKYTPTGTPITVSARHQARSGGGSIEVVVEDAGPGVPSQHLPHLFDKFYRVDSRKKKGREGIGLGLAITKGLVEAHGGHIEATNRKEGGLRVSFTIPVNGSPPLSSDNRAATAFIGV